MPCHCAALVTGTAAARAVPPAVLGRRRLPPAVNDNRPSLRRLIRVAVGPVAIVLLLAAIWRL